MSTSSRSFQDELYEEHLEEASFLYEQRLSLLTDPEIPWPELDDFEGRMETHVDALVIGETRALDICQRRSLEGDFGELYAAVCVFCRQNRKDLVDTVIDTVDGSDEERVQATADAMTAELPSSWEAEYGALMSEPDVSDATVRILARCLSTRRSAVVSHLVSALEQGPLAARQDVVWALGLIGDSSVRTVLASLLKDRDMAIRGTAMHALLRMQDLEISKRLREMVTDPELHHVVGLGGSSSLVKDLMTQVEKGASGPQTMIALGLLGDPAAVTVLISSLQDDQLAERAALALDLITGAGTREEVFVPEVIDRDELFDYELEKLDQGETPGRSDGEPFGETKVQISTDHQFWSTWWLENRADFEPGHRYRSGKQYSPSNLLENIECPDNPLLIRQLAYDELVIRYGLDVPFDPTVRVAQQRESLAAIQRWLASLGTQFRAGSWYFGGRFLA